MNKKAVFGMMLMLLLGAFQSAFSAVPVKADLTEVYSPEGMDPYFTMNAIVCVSQTVRAQIMRSMAQNLADVGVEVHLHLVEWSELLTRVVSGKLYDEGGYDASCFGWSFLENETATASAVAQLMHDLYHSSNMPTSGAGHNVLMWNNPESDALLDAALGSTDETEIESLLYEWQAVFHEEQPAAIVYSAEGSYFNNIALNNQHPHFGTGTATPLGQNEPTRAAEAARYVRQAISLTIDRIWAAANAPEQPARPGVTPVLPGWPGFNPSLKPYSLDLTEARRLFSLAGYGRTIRVPEDYSTIKEAINAAKPGDTIVVSPDVYHEQLIIDKKLTLLGQKGSQTTFDGGGSGIAVTLLPEASGSTIAGIVITNWDQGILAVDSSDCKIYNNIFIDNVIAINLTVSSTGNTICNNTISLNNIGLNLEYGGNIIYANTISESEVAIDTSNSSNSLIYYNNFVNNIENVKCADSSNIWDDEYPSGGNYWSDHNPPDEDLDKIGDLAYIIDENNTDRYPLIYPYGFVPKPDVNEDGRVNIVDLYVVARTFNTKPGDDDWNPIADVKMDENINIRDLFEVAKNYGSTV